MNGRPEDLPEALRSRLPVTVEIDKTNPAALEMLPEELRSIAKGTVDQKGADRIDIRSWAAFVEIITAGTNIDVAGLSIFGMKWPNLREAVIIAIQSIPSKQEAPAERAAK